MVFATFAEVGTSDNIHLGQDNNIAAAADTPRNRLAHTQGNPVAAPVCFVRKPAAENLADEESYATFLSFWR